MANNYFAGFTHGGTQYSAQPASAYAAPAAQTAYVQPTAQTAYAAAPRAQTYDAYQSTHSTAGQYAYTATRTQAAPTYDTSKTYYAPAAAAPAAAVTAVYTVAEPAYQAAKPTYTSTSYSAPTQPRQPTSSKPQTQPPASTTSYAYQPSTTTAASRTTTGTRSGYDAAVYSAATNYYQHSKSAGSTAGSASVTGAGSATSSTGVNPWQKKAYQQKMGMAKKMPPKPPQLHYCEVCKISCAGPQTYREHLEGQKHKKKEIAAKSSATTPSVVTRAALNQLRCELCDVACTGADAYAAHIRGAKHQKVLKLHTKLGKPIPSADPVVISTTGGATKTTVSGTATPATRTQAKTGTAATTTAAAPTVVKKVVATPKITFVGGTQLKTTGLKSEEIKVKADSVETISAASVEEDKDDAIVIPGEKDVQPVGLEYVEDIRNELGAINFYCKLCECKFNDPNAKLMHVKGRRHRLAYKKKVDPSLQVEMKPSIFGRKKQEEKLRRQAAKEEYWRRRDAEERWRMEWEQRRYEEELHQWQRMGGGRGQPFGQGGPMGMRRPDTSDDRHVMAKHASIYPNDQELQAVQNIVSSCEKSLKLVSDFLAESYGEPPKAAEVEKKEVKKEPASPAAAAPAATAKKPEADAKIKEEKKEGDKKEEDPNGQAPRALKGVMRVGVLAKGLLLHGDLNVHLVVLCSEKPTRTLLERVADNLPKQLSGVSEEKYDVKICVEDAAVIVSNVSNDKEPSTSCTITLTSPIMREENLSEGESAAVTKADPPDVLDRQKCLDALAALRHAKWFQARANGLQSCVVVIRILRDLCQRVPTWTPLNQWAMELLVEKCVSSGGTSMSPGDALRRVFEALASGILLPGGPGLYDPCEKEPTDAASTLTNQEREDITASAQHALRLITFRQIHKVLGMEQLPQPKFARKGANPRKRRRTNSQGEGPEDGDGKKDKKEGDDGKMETVGDGAQQA